MQTKHKLKPVLNPVDFSLRIDGLIRSHKHLLESDVDDVYSFTFQPQTTDDLHRLLDVANTALDTATKATASYDIREFKLNHGDILDIKVSQLFAPKVTPSDIEPWDNLRGRAASLSLQYQDDCYGNIYCECSYVDFYDRQNGVVDEPVSETVDYNFWE